MILLAGLDGPPLLLRVELGRKWVRGPLRRLHLEVRSRDRRRSPVRRRCRCTRVVLVIRVDAQGGPLARGAAGVADTATSVTRRECRAVGRRRGGRQCLERPRTSTETRLFPALDERPDLAVPRSGCHLRCCRIRNRGRRVRRPWSSRGPVPALGVCVAVDRLVDAGHERTQHAGPLGRRCGRGCRCYHFTQRMFNRTAHRTEVEAEAPASRELVESKVDATLLRRPARGARVNYRQTQEGTSSVSAY